MNNSESFDINLVGGESDAEKQIKQMNYNDLLRVRDIVNKKNGLWYSLLNVSLENPPVKTLLINLKTLEGQFNKMVFDYKKVINATIIVKRKEILKKNIIKLANSSQQKNIYNIDDPNRNTYIKDIKKLLHLI